MPDFKAQVFVCATVDAEVDGRHCGSKGGSEIRAKFNRQIVEHGLISTAAPLRARGMQRHCDWP